MYLLLRYLYNWWPAKRFFFSNKSWGCNQDWLQLIMQWQTKKKITYWRWWLKCSLECNWNLYVCKFSILIEYIHMYIIFQMISKKLALTFKWWIDEFFNRFHFFTVLLCWQHYRFDFCMRDSYEMCLITVNNMISLKPFIQSSTQFNSQWTYQITSEVFNCHL